MSKVEVRLCLRGVSLHCSTFAYISNCPQKVTENNLLNTAIGTIYSDKICFNSILYLHSIWRMRMSKSRSVVSNSLPAHGLCSPWNSPGQTTGVGCHFLLQGIFPTQGPNPGLRHCRWILYQLSHKGSANLENEVI